MALSVDFKHLPRKTQALCFSRRGFLAAFSAVALSACSSGGARGTGSVSNSSNNQDTSTKVPAYTDNAILKEPLDNGFNTGIHHATIEIKDRGTLELELNANAAPITVSNFADLVNNHFYDGLTFHRIIKDFMAQGGDPNGDGSGGAARKIKGEFSSNGIVNGVRHLRGTISMARSSANDSASSQFFIMHKDTASLDGNYAGFGRVTSGMDIIDDLCNNTPVQDSNGTVAQEDQPVIVSITMVD